MFFFSEYNKSTGFFFFSNTAYWDATRAFMILAILACFFGLLIGIMAFINYSSFGGFDKTFAAGILYFISCECAQSQ